MRKALILLFITILSFPVLADEKVKIYLKWLHQYQFAGYYAAVEQGYFKEAGLDVELVERNPKEFPLDLMVQDTGRYAVSDSSIVLHHIQGKPVLIVAAIFQHSPLVFATAKDKGFKGPLELKGKKVMYQVGQDDASVAAMFASVGLGTDDFIPVKHAFNMKPLYNGEVDAISIYLTNQVHQMKLDGFKYHIIDPSNYGVDFYGDLLVTSKMEADANPERVKAIKKAVIKGWQYVMDNQEKGIEITKAYSKKPESLIKFEAIETKKMILPRFVELGSVSLSRLERIARIYSTYEHKKYSNLKTLLFDNYIHSKSLKGIIETWWDYILIGFTLFSLALASFTYLLSRKVKNQSKKLIELNEIKDKFFSSITHELRTPLNGILGTSEHLKQGNPSKEELEEGIETIHYSSQLLLHIVNDILDMSKIKAGKFKLTPRFFKLNSLAQEIEHFFSQQAKSKGIDLIVEKKFNNNLVVNADDTRILQVLNNLISNAFKFTAKGSIKIEILDQDLNSNESFFCFKVKDTGIGMKEEDLKLLFLPFSQLEDTLKMNAKGTGLGLSITKELVEMMGGRIEVSSTFKKGSEFRVYIPLEKEQTIRQVATKETNISDISAMRFLVIDDNKINLMVLEKSLSKLGAKYVVTLSDPKDAIKNIENDHFDVVFLDLMMPEISGFDIIEKIRSHESIRVANTFVIACTANNEAYEGEFVKVGFDYHLQKPISSDLLVEFFLEYEASKKEAS